jgi:putative nucleotidyltransferase with HDIG domain
MIKKIRAANLKVGMYIHDLNMPWMEHGFANNRFLLQDEKQIEKILKTGVAEVLIDTVKGDDDAHAPTQEEADAALMDRMMAATAMPKSLPNTAKMDTQWAESKKIHNEAVKVVSNILHDARIGKQVSIEQATPVVSSITDAVLGNDGTLVSLCRIKQRDSYTFQHSVSIATLLVTFCNSIGGYSSDQLIEIGLGGLFHDAGKMRIPDAILNKPGRLTDQEFAIMRSHVTEGVKYLRLSGGLSESVLKIVAEHHERFDGSGYPKGIAHNAISKIGQMASIVDVYDAITSIRIYHTALEPSDALKRMFEWSGKHFDAPLVQEFIKSVGIYPVGSLVRLESGRLAIVLRQSEESMLHPLVRVVYNAAKGHRLPPQDIYLASPGCQDQIVGYEIPANWGIDPMKFIGKGQ